MRKVTDISLELDHAATIINRGVSAYKKSIEAISADLRPEKIQELEKAARDKLELAIRPVVPGLEGLKAEARAAVLELRDPEAALVKAAAREAAQAGPGGGALLAGAIPGLSVARLLDLAERGGPALVLLARQALHRRAADDPAAREAAPRFDAAAMAPGRFGPSPEVVGDLGGAFEGVVRAMDNLHTSTQDPRSAELRVAAGHELNNFRRSAGLDAA